MKQVPLGGGQVEEEGPRSSRWAQVLLNGHAAMNEGTAGSTTCHIPGSAVPKGKGPLYLMPASCMRAEHPPAAVSVRASSCQQCLGDARRRGVRATQQRTKLGAMTNSRISSKLLTLNPSGKGEGAGGAEISRHTSHGTWLRLEAA
eukprot:1059003-Pelagomonas_calceolata.AAC.2